MTDRDQFASAAMTALIAAAYSHDACGGDRNTIAREAYRMADAMLVARGTQPAKRQRGKPAEQPSLFAA